jgi:Ca2+-binding RTX toxin-like protein
MVKFVAKRIAVDTSDLPELTPPNELPGHAIDYSVKSHNGVATVITVKQDGALKYELSDLAIKATKFDTYFEGDFEPKLFKGADQIKGSTEGDILYGFNGNDTIDGRGGGDEIYGGKGNDILNGGTGVNTLTGDAGKDVFVFNAALGAGNYSDITDFSGKDTMQLAKGAFKGIGSKGTLAKAKFFTADEYDGKAKSVIHDQDTGTLYYAKVGGGTVSDAQSFGHVALGVELSHKDFLIA